MSTENEREAREVIAAPIPVGTAERRYQYADAILSALEEAGYTVARLERVKAIDGSPYLDTKGRAEYRILGEVVPRERHELLGHYDPDAGVVKSFYAETDGGEAAVLENFKRAVPLYRILGEDEKPERGEQ